MPLNLDEIDIALLESLTKDGRKSFNQIAREIQTSAPTVKKRFDRLVSAGLIKAIRVDLDVDKLEKRTRNRLGRFKDIPANKPFAKFDTGMSISLLCAYCKGQVSGKPHVLKFGNFERFFCCTSCKTLYAQKYKSRINLLK